MSKKSKKTVNLKEPFTVFDPIDPIVPEKPKGKSEDEVTDADLMTIVISDLADEIEKEYRKHQFDNIEVYSKRSEEQIRHVPVKAKQPHRHTFWEIMAHMVSGFLVTLMLAYFLFPEINIFSSINLALAVTGAKFVVNYTIRRIFTTLGK